MNFFIQDPKIKQKSVTVTFVVISFVLSILSLTVSHFWLTALPATSLTILLFALCMLFYRLRKIDGFKINVKSGEIEAEDREAKSGSPEDQ
jgi:hypothetical protein